VPSFVDRLDAPLAGAGLGPLKVDIAYGGDSFVILDAAPLGFAIRADEARDLAETGAALSLPPMISLVSRIPRAPAGTTSPSVGSPGCSRAREMNFRVRTPWSSVPARLTARRYCGARMATLSARGLMEKGDVYRARSIIGSKLISRTARPTTIGGRPVIVPAVSERAWITA
jgi:trans-L-3-hydroxyproline dehydratase